jgi:deazaflavin-dependent oxidoreductase (nitroreductase family)
VANAFNEGIIEEFRANAGKVGGPFAGAPMLLLTSTGARSGRPHVTPLVYLEDGGRIHIFASMGGAPQNPAWYHNLRANPDATIEVGTDQYPVRAVITSGEERDRLFKEQASRMPAFAEYQKRTSRTIPVVTLERTD